MVKQHGFSVLLALAAALVLIAALALAASTQAQAGSPPAAPEAVTARLLVSGVTDDGEKGSPLGKEATAITCTNLGAADAIIEIRVYQWTGALLYTSIIASGPMKTVTFSTQPTSLYFDDVIINAGAGGTAVIEQGAAVIFSDSPAIICTAQMLDPVGYPPAYMDKLAMYYAGGTIVGDTLKIFLPGVLKN